jgi:hypothetical protein
VTNRPRLTGDTGAGVISAAFGIAVFLLFLFVTVQLLVNLFFISSVTSAAHDAAAAAAHGGSTQAAGDDFRRALGAAGDGASLRWDTSDPDVISLQVRVPYPDLAITGALPFFDTLDRTVRVRVEQLQD